MPYQAQFSNIHSFQKETRLRCLGGLADLTSTETPLNLCDNLLPKYHQSQNWCISVQASHIQTELSKHSGSRAEGNGSARETASVGDVHGRRQGH